MISPQLVAGTTGARFFGGSMRGQRYVVLSCSLALLASATAATADPVAGTDPEPMPAGEMVEPMTVPVRSLGFSGETISASYGDDRISAHVFTHTDDVGWVNSMPEAVTDDVPVFGFD